MGANMARRYFLSPDVEPDPHHTPSFDPLYGFPERKEREMIATWEQLNDAKVPLDMRDYCAHYFLVLSKCRRDKFPNVFGCGPEKHDWDYCQYQDYVMRMKEYERERRLLARRKRIEQKKREAAAAAATAP